MLKYDPNKHVRSSYHERVSGDTGREEVSSEQKRGMPSLDVFERWQRFEEAQSSEIKKETHNMYQIRPQYEFAVQIYDVFDNEAQADAFRDKYGPGISVDIYKAVTNKWVLLQTNEECLDRVKFYDKENEILENMINQTKKDAEICREMLERRKQDAVRNNPVPVDKEALNHYLSLNEE